VFLEELMPKLTRPNLSFVTRAIPLVAPFVVLGAAFMGLGLGLAGCGDNKPKLRPNTDGGSDVSLICSGSFISPTDTSTLTAADATSGSCDGGFKTTVTIATSVPDGTSVTLQVNGVNTGAPATVSGARVAFTDVQLGEQVNMLKAVFSSTCSLSASVTVNCNTPTCNITAPTHSTLNGIPVANGGDRSSSAGAPYQVEFDVMTNIEDGQKVELAITRATAGATSQLLEGTAVSGKVVFPGVTLAPDDNYTVEASCTNKLNVVGHSTKGTYVVDSTPPALTISSPADGKFFGPNDPLLVNGAFPVCAKTSDKDATNLPTSLGAAAKNLSVAVGTGSPDATNGFVAVTAVDTDTCVNVACTSSTPINLTVTLKDAAGNATVKTISQISCATALPGVQIVSPTSDATPFSDPTKHLLASSSGNTLKDQDNTRPGAQWTTVACSDKAGRATLFAGTMGATLSAVSGPIDTVAATPTDNCPSGFANVAKFMSATLPDSLENGDETLASPSELRVDVTTATSALGSSPVVDLWIDSSVPNIQPYLPNPLCGLIHQSALDWTTTVQLLSTTGAVTLVVNSPSHSISYPTASRMSTFNTFPNVTFFQGINQVTATGSDAAGNLGVLTTPCTVTVGTPPIVTFSTPTSANTLCSSVSTTGTCVADADGATPGWQGDLAVDVTVAGTPAGSPGSTGTVTFTAGSTSLGTANIDASGHAQLAGVTIPDGNAVIISATTTDIAGNGMGISAETLIVDTIIPDAVATITPTVKDRRQTSFHLSWSAPADSGQTVASYLIKVSKSAITGANFDGATNVTYAGSPSIPGAIDGIDVVGRLIENNYYFAVAAVDQAGNRSAVTSAGPTIAHFNLKLLSGSGVESFSYSVEGVADLNGDGKSDLLVGSNNGQNAYIFNGSANFASVTAPSVVISGPGSAGFGRQFIDIGDIDGDGKDDFAISAPLAPNGRVYIFRGRTSWNPTYAADTDADYVIELDDATHSYAGTFFGSTLTRLGDFNGDGVDDFAISSYGYNSRRGRVVIVLGKVGFSGAAPDIQTIDGDPAYPTGSFGYVVLGIGKFYTATQGTSLVVGAPGSAPNGRGRVYAFHGRPGTTGALVATAADNFIDGPIDNGAYGSSLTLVGALAGVPGVALNTALNTSLGAGVVDLYYGSTTVGPFGVAPLRFTDSLASGTDTFGWLTLGCALPGTATTVSVIGDSKPDVIMLPYKESGGGPSRIYIVDGARFSTLTSPTDVVTAADVILPLPSDWQGVSLQRNGMIRDLDGDGYADFAIGENVANTAGRLAVYW
jgi:hypothetical protein